MELIPQQHLQENAKRYRTPSRSRPPLPALPCARVKPLPSMTHGLLHQHSNGLHVCRRPPVEVADYRLPVCRGKRGSRTRLAADERVDGDGRSGSERLSRFSWAVDYPADAASARAAAVVVAAAVVNIGPFVTRCPVPNSGPDELDDGLLEVLLV